jgi:hypothetical protein
MIKNLCLNKILFLITGILALIAAVMGVLKPEMYIPVVNTRVIPGVFTQDVLVILAAIVLIILAMWIKQDDVLIYSISSLNNSAIEE